jgi:hypothetical protein
VHSPAISIQAFPSKFSSNYPLCNVVTLPNLQQVFSFQFAMPINNFVKHIDVHDFDFLPIEEKAIASFVILTVAKL